jgi:hypothetical protein
MNSDRKKPSVAFWAIVVVVVFLVAYPLSFGPACWWVSRSADPELVSWSVLGAAPEPRAPGIYWPIGWLAENGPRPLSRFICWYATAWKRGVYLPADRDGNNWLRP